MPNWNRRKSGEDKRSASAVAWIGLIVALVSLGLSGFDFYWSRIRKVEKATVTVLNLGFKRDGSEERTVTDVVFNNEGNTELIVSEIVLEFSKATNEPASQAWYANIVSPLTVQAGRTMVWQVNFGHSMRDWIEIGQQGQFKHITVSFGVLDRVGKEHRTDVYLAEYSYSEADVPGGGKRYQPGWSDILPKTAVLLPSLVTANPIRRYVR